MAALRRRLAVVRSCAALLVLAGASAQRASCATNASAACPLPPWPATYNLSRSTIMYLPWCINDGDPNICTGLANLSGWFAPADPSRRDKGSVREAHWGLVSIDDSTSTQMWAGTTYAGSTPGDPNTFAAQQAMLDNCNFVKAHGWADRCMVYDNMVPSLGWYESHRRAMKNASLWPMFNVMNNQNASMNLTNYTGLPFREPLGTVVPCWSLPNTSDGFDQHAWCGEQADMSDIRLPCFFDGTCGQRSGDGEGLSYYWNYSAPGAIEWRVADNLAFVLAGGDGVDGLFTDEMEMHVL
jgi:hypothetical protein